MFTIKDLWKLVSAPLLAKMFKRYYFNYIDVPIKDLPRKYLPWVDDNTIVVYPEIAKGNFLKAKNVVRWLLYHHTYTDGEYDKENDLVYVCDPLNGDVTYSMERYFQIYEDMHKRAMTIY